MNNKKVRVNTRNTHIEKQKTRKNDAYNMGVTV